MKTCPSTLALTLISLLIHFPFASPAAAIQESAGKGSQDSMQMDLSNWNLQWQDEFDYPDGDLDKEWEAQNGPSTHILCSRWRENAVVKDGILHLINKKEQRGGQQWTSASIWTKRKFKYGYFECRYRYAEATGTNNSFWLMTKGPDPVEGKRFEIDINEGHYPNEVNTNVHNWTDVVETNDGQTTHPSSHKGFAYGTRPDYDIPFEIPVTTKKLRLTSSTSPHFHIRDFRIFNVKARYPKVLSTTGEPKIAGLVNHAVASNVKVTASGVYNKETKPQHAADGDWNTSWVSPDKGNKWLMFEWPRPVTIGCIQFVNGWQSNGEWTGWGQLTDYKIQAFEDDRWVDISTMDSKDNADFGANYHTFGLLWTEQEIVFYQDRREIRRMPNTFCHSESPIWLSQAIISWAGTVSDEIDGTSMKIDWVRYYQKR